MSTGTDPAKALQTMMEVAVDTVNTVAHIAMETVNKMSAVTIEQLSHAARHQEALQTWDASPAIFTRTSVLSRRFESACLMSSSKAGAAKHCHVWGCIQERPIYDHPAATFTLPACPIVSIS